MFFFFFSHLTACQCLTQVFYKFSCLLLFVLTAFLFFLCHPFPFSVSCSRKSSQVCNILYIFNIKDIEALIYYDNCQINTFPVFHLGKKTNVLRTIFLLFLQLKITVIVYPTGNSDINQHHHGQQMACSCVLFWILII